MPKKPSMILPGGVALIDVAEASRHAVRGFLELEASKPALVGWLRGPYRAATRFGPRRLGTPSEHEPATSGPLGLEAIIVGAQAEVASALRATLTSPGAEALVRRLPPFVQIVAARDIYGASGFIPIDARRGRLADRVLALILSDYLTRPDDFLARPPAAGSARSPELRADTIPTQPLMRATRR
jgi:hypothetical protein